MKISFKTTVLRQNRNKDNTYPVYIRIGFRSKYEYLRTDLYISEKELDKKLNIKSKTILRKGLSIENEYQTRIESSGMTFENVKQVRDYLENKRDERINCSLSVALKSSLNCFRCKYNGLPIIKKEAC